MKRLIICLLFIGAVSAVQAQDYLGAEFTGQITYGIYLKYNGKLGIGASINQKIFKGPFSKPIDINANFALTPLRDKKISIGYNLSVYQLYANASDFQTSFGLGAGLGLRGEYCPILPKTENKDHCNKVAITANLYPGVHASTWATCAIIEKPVKTFNYGCAHAENEGFKIDDLRVGLHFDQLKNKRHINTDLIIDLGANSYANTKNPDKTVIEYLNWDKDKDCESESPISYNLGINYRY